MRELSSIDVDGVDADAIWRENIPKHYNPHDPLSKIMWAQDYAKLLREAVEKI